MFDTRTVELISLGASVAANCYPCLQYHVKKALESGITEQEIKEAIEAGRTVRKGAAYKMDTYIANLNAESSDASCGDSQGCGCNCS